MCSLQVFDSNVNKEKLLRLKLGAGKVIKVRKHISHFSTACHAFVIALAFVDLVNTAPFFVHNHCCTKTMLDRLLTSTCGPLSCEEEVCKKETSISICVLCNPLVLPACLSPPRPGLGGGHGRHEERWEAFLGDSP